MTIPAHMSTVKAKAKTDEAVENRCIAAIWHGGEHEPDASPGYSHNDSTVTTVKRDVKTRGEAGSRLTKCGVCPEEVSSWREFRDHCAKAHQGQDIRMVMYPNRQNVPRRVETRLDDFMIS